MQLKFFTLPIFTVDDEVDNLNKFLRSVKILEMRREFVLLTEGAYWAICISYLPMQSSDSNGVVLKKIDYKDILNESSFQRFTKFRKIRKQLSEEDAVPAYAVFTDAELAELAQLKTLDLNSLKQVKGIGSRKLEKYGQRFIEVFIADYANEESRMSD